jgi:arylsulfatase A-like enzyme
VKPQVLLLNLPLTDEVGHASGGITKMKVMTPVLKNVDVQLGKLMDAYKKAGIYDQTLFVVTADHGMTPRLKIIDDTILKNILTGQVAVPGGRADYYLNNPENAWFIAEMISVFKIEGIDAVYYKTINENGGYIYKPTFTTSETLPKDLDSCFRYLGATYASAKSPDLIIITRENWKFANSKMVGDHGQPTWNNQHIPLIFAGPGVKKGISDSTARLVDIAPTIISLIGLKPIGMDGVVLADIKQNPSKKETENLASLNKWLKPLMQAFKDLSIKNSR